VLAAAGTAAAGTLGVAPVRAELSSTASIAVVTVRNPADASIVVQARPALWTQHHEQDQLDETHELLVTPPLFTIPPKGEQTVRVALLRKPDPSRELDYRLVLSEVPPLAAPEGNQLRVALRITMPVFVKAATSTSADLSWHHTTLPDGTLRIEARNGGSAHLQVLALDVDTGQSDQTLHTDNARYLLPGSVAHWDLHSASGIAPATHLTIHGHSDAGELNATSEPGAQ
jgi:fimbrial chaperone protein